MPIEDPPSLSFGFHRWAFEGLLIITIYAHKYDSHMQYTHICFGIGYLYLIHHFPTCYAYSIKKPIGELNLERAFNEDTYTVLIYCTVFMCIGEMIYMG